jgi:hypothetical protein
MNTQDRRNNDDGNARWLEVFEIRSSTSERAIIESKLEALTCEIGNEESIESIKFYRHAEFLTDWSIHLCYTCDSPVTTDDALGLRILSSLQELGSVYHSIWRELRSC